MWPSVSAAWMPFNNQLEGHLTFMYLDILGYVTTGMGNLVDPVETALGLPWVYPANGSPATQDEIRQAWETVDALRSDPKGRRQMSGPATHYGQAFAGYTAIRLTGDGVSRLVAMQVDVNETTLRRFFPGYDTLPADAQMCINSMAWAMGAGFPATFKAFTAAINAGDYETAVANADFRGTGVAPRIAANKVMLANAAIVSAQSLDPGTLYYPGSPPTAA